jgi:hypothetical protein
MKPMFKFILNFFKSMLSLFGFSVAPKQPEVELEFDEDREAKIILTRSKQQFVVPKWTPLSEVLPYDMFSCKQGHCGTCTVYIQDGEENLVEKKKTAHSHGLSRRACQVSIKEGIVKIKA